ncbi:hypothetical protein HY572_01320 [Candidatus Micrarchaeota archaeon]|nr:hypothetical protein [Candidatus Micrarchaeota archaeon]
MSFRYGAQVNKLKAHLMEEQDSVVMLQALKGPVAKFHVGFRGRAESDRFLGLVRSTGVGEHVFVTEIGTQLKLEAKRDSPDGKAILDMLARALQRHPRMRT